MGPGVEQGIRGEALAAIQHGPWDLVVLQQGPSALPASRTNLLEWVTRFATEIRRAGAWCAALVIYAVAASTSPLGLTARSGGAPYPPGQIAVLEAAAADAIQRLGTRSGAILLPPKPDGGSM